MASPIQPSRTGLGPAHRRGTIRRDTAVTLLVAIAAGIAGGMAHGSPTGISALDVALKVVLAVGCVLAGRLTPWPFVAAAAAVSAVASYRSPAALVAVAVFGLVLLGWRLDSPSRRLWLGVLRAGLCGALACIVLRADWPHISLVPSLLAGATCLVILVPALVVTPAPVRRIVVRLSGLVVLAAILLTALAGVALLQARSPLEAALTAARSGLSAAEHGDQATATTEFQLAESAFVTADNDLRWARAAEVVPVVSQQIRAIRSAAAVGTSLAQAGLTTTAKANLSSLKVVHGVFPVARLAALKPVFTADLQVLDRVSGDTGTWSSPWLVGTVKNKLTSEKSRLAQARHDAGIALMASQQVPGILGADGQRTYLGLVENTAESRASGGVIGDYAEVSADAGRLHLVKVGSVAQLNQDGTPPLKRTLPTSNPFDNSPIQDFKNRYGTYFPQDHWENIVMSPDFQTVGDVAEYLYPQSGGTQVNGVISLDPSAMAGFLKILGPINAHAKGLKHPVRITEANVTPFLAHDEFIDFKSNTLRIAFVEGLLKQVWHELTSRSLPPANTIAKALAPAIRNHDLMMYSKNPSVEGFFEAIHTAGQSWAPVSGDFLGVVTQNAAGNKIDWYVRRKIAYDATVNLSQHTISSTVTLSISNSAPTSGLPSVVIDGLPGTGTTPGEAQLWVSIYSPWELESATYDGHAEPMTTQSELGRLVYGAVIRIPSGSTGVLEIHLAGTWPSSLSHYQLSWYHQPMLFPDQVATKVNVIT